MGIKLNEFSNVDYIVHAVSSKNGFGVEELKTSIVEAMEKFPTRDLKGKEESLIKLLLENKTLQFKRKKQKIGGFKGKIERIARNSAKKLENSRKST